MRSNCVQFPPLHTGGHWSLPERKYFVTMIMSVTSSMKFASFFIDFKTTRELKSFHLMMNLLKSAGRWIRCSNCLNSSSRRRHMQCLREEKRKSLCSTVSHSEPLKGNKTFSSVGNFEYVDSCLHDAFAWSETAFDARRLAGRRNIKRFDSRWWIKTPKTAQRGHLRRTTVTFGSLDPEDLS